MSGTSSAREAGEQVVGSLCRSVEGRIADLLRRDPDRVSVAAELGIVDRSWLEHPGEHPIRTATSIQVLQRFLEKVGEQRPSALASIGTSTLQLLSWGADRSAVDGTVDDVAVVFTDLEGFTRFTADHGDEAALGALSDLQRRAGPVVRSRGGRIVKRLGDGLMLSFPTAESAVLAAVELLGVAPEPLRLRAGAHVGQATVTHDDVLGHVVNVAARVTEQAKGGQALVTTDVRDCVGAQLQGIAFGRARRASLRGVPETVRVVPVRADPVRGSARS
ncbi:MAG: adenylate/guanylate cyclase domain-containing protein [Actinobacteria bacterium]|nr:adenylate/guanylate cyclase domain-containing protein [Actinomycetota bacterium]